MAATIEQPLHHLCNAQRLPEQSHRNKFSEFQQSHCNLAIFCQRKVTQMSLACVTGALHTISSRNKEVEMSSDTTRNAGHTFNCTFISQVANPGFEQLCTDVTDTSYLSTFHLRVLHFTFSTTLVNYFGCYTQT